MTTQIIGYMSDPTSEAMTEEKQRKKMKRTLYFLRQKVVGAAAILTGIIACSVSHEGIVAAMLIIPYGMAMMLGKTKMMTEEEDCNE